VIIKCSSNYTKIHLNKILNFLFQLSILTNQSGCEYIISFVDTSILVIMVLNDFFLILCIFSQVLGMERLKSELLKNGLKCGGTLQERAARLFLLKTTPIDKLPKKILAKPLA
jgi:Replication stress response SDE2 C-terminal